MLLHGLKPGLGVHRQAPGRKPTASASLNPLSRISKGSCLQGLLFLALKPLLSLVQFGCSIVSNSATSWTAARQASPSITNSRSLLKLMSIELVMPSSHFILCHPLLLLPPIPPASGSFPMSQSFEGDGQSTGVSALASVLPMNTHD